MKIFGIEFTKEPEEDFSVSECIVKWVLNILCVTFLLAAYGGGLFIGTSAKDKTFTDIPIVDVVIAAVTPICIVSVISLIFIIVFRKKLSSDRLLARVFFIKFSLIPLYAIGGTVIVLALLLIISPVVIMIFVGPTVAIVLAIIGWVYLVCSSVFSIPFIIKSLKEGAKSKILHIFSIVAQYCYVLDVVSMIILAIKEKKGKVVKYSLLAIVVMSILTIVMFSLLDVLFK